MKTFMVRIICILLWFFSVDLISATIDLNLDCQDDMISHQVKIEKSAVSSVNNSFISIGMIETANYEFPLQRLGNLGFSVSLIPPNSGINRLQQYDIIYLPVGWAERYGDYDVIESHAGDYHTYVNSGGGLFIDQPNPYQQPGGTVVPTVIPYPITFYNSYETDDWPPIIIDPDHEITKGLPETDMPFPADQMIEVDDLYDILVVGRETGSASLAAGHHGNGRILVQTAHPGESAGHPFSDEVYIRMVTWVSNPQHLVTGPGPGYENQPLVRIFPPLQDATPAYQFEAYGVAHYGARVGCGDVDGDGSDEILTGSGPGNICGPHVRGFEADGTQLPGLSFYAYGTIRWGVNVTAGNIDGDEFDEIITGAGPGVEFGPHVRGWNYDGTGGVTAITTVSYFAYGTPRWGVNVSAGDIDGDGYDEIVTGAGPGAVYGPHVRGWNVDGGPAAAIPEVSFLAHGTNKYGVNVACGDLDGDGMAELVTGAGPGLIFGAHVRGWNYDGAAVTELPGINFFAWPPAETRYGAEVFAGADLDEDGRDELVVGCGPDPDTGSPVRVYRYDGAQLTQWFDLEAYRGLTHGTNVAAGRF